MRQTNNTVRPEPVAGFLPNVRILAFRLLDSDLGTGYACLLIAAAGIGAALAQLQP